MAVQIDPKTGERIGSSSPTQPAPQIDPQTGERMGAAPSTPAPATMFQSGVQTAKDFGKGILKGAVHTMSSADNLASKIPGIGQFMTTPIGQTPNAENSQKAIQAAQTMATPHNTAQSIGRGTEQAAEFLAPTGLEQAGAKAAGFGGRLLGSALHSGAINKVQGGDFSTGAAGGAIGTGIAAGLKVAAPALAETAMRVRGNDRMFGRTVGDAILNDTKGVLPGTVAQSAQEKIGQLTPQLEQKAANASAAGNRGSLLPARQGVEDTINKHLTNRAAGSAAELSPLQSHLATDSTTGLPLSQSQTPTGLLQLKRGLNSDFIQNWRPDQPPGLRSSARGAYGKLADEFHAAAPGTQELDQRVSSLIPVVKRAEDVDRGAGLLQRTAGRLGAHTGALVGSSLGASAGYKEGGLPGAIAGGTAGIVLPEMMASPTAQMIGARALNGSIPRFVVPALKGGALQANRKKEDEE